MELRKDPITQSWVILGQREALGDAPEECPLEPAKIEKLRSILTWPAEGAWQVRVLPHPEPLYHVEGEPARLAKGCTTRWVRSARTRSWSRRRCTTSVCRSSATKRSSACYGCGPRESLI